MADYPGWVLEHKRKGTYINKVGDKYYLYAAHSERVKGTDKVRRVSDGYLGRITEQDGFIPARDKVKEPPAAYEIGLSYAIVTACEKIHLGLKRSYRSNGDMIYVCAILSHIYGSYGSELFGRSYLHILFPGTVIPASFTKTQATGIERGYRMISGRLPLVYGDDLPYILAFFPDIRLMMIDKRYYLSHLSENDIAISQKYGIDWRNPLWQR